MSGPIDPRGCEYTYDSPELYTEHTGHDEPVEDLAEAERRMAAARLWCAEVVAVLTPE